MAAATGRAMHRPARRRRRSRSRSFSSRGRHQPCHHNPCGDDLQRIDPDRGRWSRKNAAPEKNTMTPGKRPVAENPVPLITVSIRSSSPAGITLKNQRWIEGTVDQTRSIFGPILLDREQFAMKIKVVCNKVVDIPSRRAHDFTEARRDHPDGRARCLGTRALRSHRSGPPAGRTRMRGDGRS